MKLKMGFPYFSQGTGGTSVYPFEDMFEAVALKTPDDMENVDALVLWGGEDISPIIYDAEPSVKAGTAYLDQLGRRDLVEIPLFKKAVELGKPILGICRGAQLACALSGGKLVQDVRGHGGFDHGVQLEDGSIIQANSLHHQMMYPYMMDKSKYKLLGWSVNALSARYVMDDSDVRNHIEDPEPEIVFFPETKALAIQAHPEFMDPREPFVDLCKKLIKEYLL